MIPALDLFCGLAGGTRMVDCIDADDHAGNLWHPIDGKPARTRELIRTKQEQSGMRRGMLNNVGDGVRMRGLDDLAPTITTQTGTQLMLVDGDRVRIVNPYELSRMMGWRDEELTLPKNRKLAGRLVGNSIPVQLAHGIITQTLEILA